MEEKICKRCADAEREEDAGRPSHYIHCQGGDKECQCMCTTQKARKQRAFFWSVNKGMLVK